MLEKFEKFEIKKQENIFGGTIHPTVVISTNSANNGRDYWDDVTDRWFEICEAIT